MKIVNEGYLILILINRSMISQPPELWKWICIDYLSQFTEIRSNCVLFIQIYFTYDVLESKGLHSLCKFHSEKISNKEYYQD